VDRRSSLSFVRAVPAALLLALAAPAVAQAKATLSVTGTAPHKVLVVIVDDALDHLTRASMSDGHLVVEDDAGIDVGGSSCTAVDEFTADCGPGGDFERLAFAFGNGDDLLDVDDDFPIGVSADGGGGDDVLTGGVGDDRLTGSQGADELYGSGGDDGLDGRDGVDVLDGGGGDDRLWSADYPPVPDALIACGAGDDTVEEYDDADTIDSDCETTDPPQLDGTLVITGEPRVGNELRLSLPTNVGGDGVATIEWLRCSDGGVDCWGIGGADGTTYTPTEAVRGFRIRARYTVQNTLGNDSVESDATEVVAAGAPTHHPTPHPQPHPHPTPLPAQRLGAPPKLSLGPFVRARKPSFAMRNGRPVVDTGRSISCRGPFYDYACRLSVTARPSGASARLRGRPAIAGTSNVLVAFRARAKVMVPLNRTAYRLLRAHDKLTLSVTATFTRLGYPTLRRTFTVTVKAPALGRR
jgi:hemolysin type calcium-binding protein